MRGKALPDSCLECVPGRTGAAALHYAESAIKLTILTPMKPEVDSEGQGILWLLDLLQILANHQYARDVLGIDRNTTLQFHSPQK